MNWRGCQRQGLPGQIYESMDVVLTPMLSRSNDLEEIWSIVGLMMSEISSSHRDIPVMKALGAGAMQD